MKLGSEQLRALSGDQLSVHIVELRKQLLELALRATTTHVRDFSSQRRNLRKTIARALTIQREQV